MTSNPAHRHVIDMVMAVKDCNKFSLLQSISKTKIRGVLALLKHGDMLNTSGIDGLPVNLFLADGMSSVEALRERHDAYLYQFIKEHNLSMRRDLWVEIVWKNDIEFRAEKLASINSFIADLRNFYNDLSMTNSLSNSLPISVQGMSTSASGSTLELIYHHDMNDQQFAKKNEIVFGGSIGDLDDFNNQNNSTAANRDIGFENVGPPNSTVYSSHRNQTHLSNQYQHGSGLNSQEFSHRSNHLNFSTVTDDLQNQRLIGHQIIPTNYQNKGNPMNSAKILNQSNFISPQKLRNQQHLYNQFQPEIRQSRVHVSSQSVQPLHYSEVPIASASSHWYDGVASSYISPSVYNRVSQIQAVVNPYRSQINPAGATYDKFPLDDFQLDVNSNQHIYESSFSEDVPAIVPHDNSSIKSSNANIQHRGTSLLPSDLIVASRNFKSITPSSQLTDQNQQSDSEVFLQHLNVKGNNSQTDQVGYGHHFNYNFGTGMETILQESKHDIMNTFIDATTTTSETSTANSSDSDAGNNIGSLWNSSTFLPKDSFLNASSPRSKFGTKQSQNITDSEQAQTFGSILSDQEHVPIESKTTEIRYMFLESPSKYGIISSSLFYDSLTSPKPSNNPTSRFWFPESNSASSALSSTTAMRDSMKDQNIFNTEIDLNQFSSDVEFIQGLGSGFELGLQNIHLSSVVNDLNSDSNTMNNSRIGNFQFNESLRASVHNICILSPNGCTESFTVLLSPQAQIVMSNEICFDADQGRSIFPERIDVNNDYGFEFNEVCQEECTECLNGELSFPSRVEEELAQAQFDHNG